MWVTSVPLLVFLGLSFLELGPMYATDVTQKYRLMPPPYGGGGIKSRINQSCPNEGAVTHKPYSESGLSQDGHKEKN